MLNFAEETSLPLFARRAGKRWRPAASVFAAVLALTAAVIFLLPNQYRTHLKIVVKSERAEPAIGADKQAQAAVPPGEVTEAQINTEIQVMTSADVLRQVVARCHLGDLAGSGRNSRESRNEMALRQLEKTLAVAAIHGSNVIDASYEAADARRAADVLKALSDIYIASHREVHGAAESLAALETISGGYATQLAAAEEALARFAQAHRIVTLAEQKTLALANIARLEAQIQDGAAAARKNAQTASHLRRDLDLLPPSVERQRRSVPNQAAAQQLSATLLTLQNKRDAAVLRYQPGERALTEIDDQIARTQDALNAAETSKVEEITMGADPSIDTARGVYLITSAEEAGNEAQARELIRQLASDRARLATLEAQSVTYGELQRKVAALEELDESSHRAAESARISRMLEARSAVNLAVVERPFELPLPTSPRRGLLLMLGLVWSLGLGLGTAVVSELLTDRIQSPFELAQASGMPVLASIPSGAVPSHGQATFPALFLAMQRDPGQEQRRIA